MRRSLDVLIALFGAAFLLLGSALAVRSMQGMAGTDPVTRMEGVCLVGVSALLLIRRTPAGGLARALRGNEAGVSPGGPSGSRGIEASVRDRAVAAALLSFAVLQLLDVVTTLRGAASGLREGNRLAAEIMALPGPGTGFVAVKVATVIVVMLAVARLPRHIALMTGWGCCSLMAIVVLHNAYLIAGMAG